MEQEVWEIEMLIEIAERADLTETGQKNCAKTMQALFEENKQWETNYNNLSAEFEEISAIAQAQAKEIERLNRIIRGFPPKDGVNRHKQSKGCWCDGCWRLDGYECEAFKEPYENCFAKETDRNRYLNAQLALLRYNKEKHNNIGTAACTRSVRRARGWDIGG